MSNHRGKFLFDTEFAEGEPLPEEEVQAKPRFTEEDLVAARREGQEAGFQMGLEQAKRQLEAQLADAMTAAADKLGGLQSAMQADLETVKADATQIAVKAASRLAPALIARQPLAELSEMVADCLRQMPTEPRVVIRVAEPLVESLEAQIAELGRAAGFAGQLVLIGEPDMAQGDARVEWADGGAERNLGALQADIEAAVDRYCRAQHDLAQRTTAPPPVPEPAPRNEPPAAIEPLANDEQADDIDTALPALAGVGNASQGTDVP
ncbi:MAG: FliH/SctL family protein [Alphaproteobacteria bacterium]